MRNRLIHGYDSFDLDVVWATVTTDLQPLVASIVAWIGLDSGDP